MTKTIFVIASLFMFSACTDAKAKQWSTLGDPAFIVCYSGGREIYRGRSTGKIASEQTSDGWYFEDAKTHKLMRISADCIIEN